MSEATIEVDGAVYTLASSAMNDNTQTYTTGSGDLYTMRIGAACAHVMTRDFAAQALVKGAPHPCRLTLGGTAYTGYVWVEGWSHSDQQVDLIVENLEAIPATPTLDELTDPADLDWGALRSAADDRRDWREAWGIVGTDHTGDATPGEVYLLSVARHKSATAAALHHWRELRERVIPLGKGNLSWQRIKGIAAWESSARAQYDERGNRRGRLQAAVRERTRIRRTTTHGYTLTVDGQPISISTPYMVGGPFGGSAMRAIIDDPVTSPEWAAIYDRIADLLQAAMPAGLSRGYRTAEDNAMTRGNGGVVGVLNNPYLSAAANRGEITGTVTTPPSTSATIAATLERYASMTGNTMNVQGDGRGRIVVTPRNTNPAPRGPQTRKRR